MNKIPNSNKSYNLDLFKLMSSIDHRDAEVQNHFTVMKRAADDSVKFRIAEQLAKMYEKNDDYTYGV